MLPDKKSLLILVSLLLSVSLALSDDSGRTRGNYLKINSNPETAAMGETETARDESGAYSVSDNPSCLGLSGVKNIGFTYNRWFEGTNIGYAGIDYPVNRRYAFGVGLNYLSDGMEGYDINNINTGFVSANSILLTLGNALSLGDKIRIGLNIKYITESIGNYSDKYSAFDAGILFSATDKFSLGGEIKNIWNKYGLYSEDYSLPVYWKLGAGYNEKLYKILFDAGHYVDTGFIINSGFELSLKDMLFLRLGYKYQFGEKNLSESMSSISGGLGIKYKDIKIDYAILPHIYLGLTHRLGLSFSFGDNIYLSKEIEVVKAIPEKKKEEIAVKEILPKEPEKKQVQEVVNLAVISFVPQEPVSSGEASFVTEFFRGYLVQSKAFRIVEKQNMDKILAEQGFQQTGCTTQECVIQMGKILNVKMMITGQFGKLISRYILTINMVDIETGEIVYSDKGDCESDRDIDDMVQQLVKRLVDNWGKNKQ